MFIICRLFRFVNVQSGIFYLGGINMNKRDWKTWAKCAGMRALKTVAQTAVATIGTAAVLESVNWLMVLSASVLAGVLSLLTSVAGLPEVKEETE